MLQYLSFLVKEIKPIFPLPTIFYFPSAPLYELYVTETLPQTPWHLLSGFHLWYPWQVPAAFGFRALLSLNSEHLEVPGSYYPRSNLQPMMDWSLKIGTSCSWPLGRIKLRHVLHHLLEFPSKTALQLCTSVPYLIAHSLLGFFSLFVLIPLPSVSTLLGNNSQNKLHFLKSFPQGLLVEKLKLRQYQKLSPWCEILELRVSQSDGNENSTVTLSSQ